MTCSLLYNATAWSQEHLTFVELEDKFTLKADAVVERVRGMHAGGVIRVEDIPKTGELLIDLTSEFVCIARER